MPKPNEKAEKRIARIEREMALGKWRYVLRYGVLRWGIATGICYFALSAIITGYDKRLLFVGAFSFGLPFGGFLGLACWNSFPLQLEYLKQADPHRLQTRRDSQLAAWLGILPFLLAPFLCPVFGPEALPFDVMATATGVVLLGWSSVNTARYWRAHSDWATRSWRDRFNRLWVVWFALTFLTIWNVLRFFVPGLQPEF